MNQCKLSSENSYMGACKGHEFRCGEKYDWTLCRTETTEIMHIVVDVLSEKWMHSLNDMHTA